MKKMYFVIYTYLSLAERKGEMENEVTQSSKSVSLTFVCVG